MDFPLAFYGPKTLSHIHVVLVNRYVPLFLEMSSFFQRGDGTLSPILTFLGKNCGVYPWPLWVKGMWLNVKHLILTASNFFDFKMCTYWRCLILTVSQVNALQNSFLFS